MPYAPQYTVSPAFGRRSDDEPESPSRAAAADQTLCRAASPAPDPSPVEHRKKTKFSLYYPTIVTSLHGLTFQRTRISVKMPECKAGTLLPALREAEHGTPGKSGREEI